MSHRDDSHFTRVVYPAYPTYILHIYVYTCTHVGMCHLGFSYVIVLMINTVSEYVRWSMEGVMGLGYNVGGKGSMWGLRVQCGE